MTTEMVRGTRKIKKLVPEKGMKMCACCPVIVSEKKLVRMICYEGGRTYIDDICEECLRNWLEEER